MRIVGIVGLTLIAFLPLVFSKAVKDDEGDVTIFGSIIVTFPAIIGIIGLACGGDFS